MPRGRKANPKTFEEQLAAIENEMAQHKQRIDELKGQKKAIIAAKEKAEMEQLMEAVKASGKSPSDFLAVIKETAQNGDAE